MESFYHRSFMRKLGLVAVWRFTCVICGHGFKSVACVTEDHIVPRSRGGKTNFMNVAPVHYGCNELKADDSLLVAVRRVEKLEKRIGAKQFQQWLAKTYRDPQKCHPDSFLPLFEAYVKHRGKLIEWRLNRTPELRIR